MSTIKIKIDRELFFSKISKVIKFVSTPSVIPAFDNFKLTVSGGMMEIVAGDPAMQCKMKCPVSKSEDFSVCVPAKLLVKTVGLFRENELIMTLKTDKNIELKSGKSKYNISTDCLPNDFPNMQMASSDSEIIISQFFLKQAFKSAQQFIDEKGANSNIIGVNVAEVNNKIVFTGADDRIMCRAAIKPISISKWESIVIPPETAKNITSLLDDKGEVVIVHCKDKFCAFTDVNSLDHFEVMGVVANAKFPNSEKFFSKIPESFHVINSMEMLDAVKRLELYTPKEEIPVIKFNVASDSELVLSSEDSKVNKNGEEHVSYTNTSDIKLTKSFNAKNIIKILSIVEANEFKFHFNESPNHPSFVIPHVATEEENIYSFLLTNML